MSNRTKKTITEKIIYVFILIIFLAIFVVGPYFIWIPPLEREPIALQKYKEVA